jgi:Arc/MetJ-type ribon-helix-helix transcriptional regulator
VNAPLPLVSTARSSDDRAYERFAISMPAAMADMVREVCAQEARSQSEFFREAVRHYLAEKGLTLAGHPRRADAKLAPTSKPFSPKSVDNPFADFSEWEADAEYDALIPGPVRNPLAGA